MTPFKAALSGAGSSLFRAARFDPQSNSVVCGDCKDMHPLDFFSLVQAVSHVVSLLLLAPTPAYPPVECRSQEVFPRTRQVSERTLNGAGLWSLPPAVAEVGSLCGTYCHQTTRCLHP